MFDAHAFKSGRTKGGCCFETLKRSTSAAEERDFRRRGKWWSFRTQTLNSSFDKFVYVEGDDKSFTVPAAKALFGRRYGHRSTPSFRQTCLKAVSEIPNSFAASFCFSSNFPSTISRLTSSGLRPRTRSDPEAVRSSPSLWRGKMRTPSDTSIAQNESRATGVSKQGQ